MNYLRKLIAPGLVLTALSLSGCRLPDAETVEIDTPFFDITLEGVKRPAATRPVEK